MESNRFVSHFRYVSSAREGPQEVGDRIDLFGHRREHSCSASSDGKFRELCTVHATLGELLRDEPDVEVRREAHVQVRVEPELDVRRIECSHGVDGSGAEHYR